MPPTPASISLSPSSGSVIDNAGGGSLLCSVMVKMSDGSGLSGTTAVCSDPLAMVTTSGMSLRLRRRLTAADDGVHNIIVTATKNGGTVSGIFALTVNARVAPTPVSVILRPSSLSLTGNELAGTLLCNIAVKMSDGSFLSGRTATCNDPLASVTKSGGSLRLKRNLTIADAGVHNIIVSAV